MLLTMKSSHQRSASALCRFPAHSCSTRRTMWFPRRSSLKSLASTLISYSPASKNSQSLAPFGTTYGYIQPRKKARERLRSLKMPTIALPTIRGRWRQRLRWKGRQCMTSSRVSVDSFPSSWTSQGLLSAACKRSVFQTRLSRSFTHLSSLAIAEKTALLTVTEIYLTEKTTILRHWASPLLTRVKSRWGRRLRNGRLSLTSTAGSGASGALTMSFVAVWGRRKSETISCSTMLHPSSKKRWICLKYWRSLESINSPLWQV